MTIVKKLYELQQLDLEIQKEQESLEEINRQLGESEALLKVRLEFVAGEEHLTEISKRQRDLEWEIEDTGSKIAQMQNKLYGGGVKNPKELVSIEQEVGLFKAQLAQKEDALLDIMADVESTQKRLKVNIEQLRVIEEEWQKGQKSLSQQQAVVESHITDLEQRRKELTAAIPRENLELYEVTRLRRGQAVVKIEQGRCQGCRLTLSTSELQRARAGNLIQCSTCNRIVYLG